MKAKILLLNQRISNIKDHILNSQNENSIRLIILFGSQARGQATNKCDIDLLVVLKGLSKSSMLSPGTKNLYKPRQFSRC